MLNRARNVQVGEKNISGDQIATIYPNSYEEQGRRTEIPGITIEHLSSADQSKGEKEQVRKDEIPESDNSKKSMVQDANNEPDAKRSVVAGMEPLASWETKRSQYPNYEQGIHTPTSPFSYSADNAALDMDSQFITKSKVPAADETQTYGINTQNNMVMQNYQAPISNYMDEDEDSVQLKSTVTSTTDTEKNPSQETNSTLPTGEELERTKIQREMHLIGQLQNMKKSTIPHANTDIPRSHIPNTYQQNAYQSVKSNAVEAKNEVSDKRSDISIMSMVHDSTPLMLHRHAAEGTRETIPKPKPTIQIMMKKDSIPSTEQLTQRSNIPTAPQQQPVYNKPSYNDNMLEVRSNIPAQTPQVQQQQFYQQPAYNAAYFLPPYGMKTIPQKQPLSDDTEITKKSKIPNGHKEPQKNVTLISEDDNNTDETKGADLLDQQADMEPVAAPELKPEPERTETGSRKDVISSSTYPEDSFPLRLRVLPPI